MGAKLERDPWLVVFDLDGTLINSTLDICLAVNAALQHLEYQSLPDEVITSLIGNGAEVLLQGALKIAKPLTSQNPVAKEADVAKGLRFFLQYYRVHKLDNTHLYDGVLPALEGIRARRPHLPMAVLTNKPVGPARQIAHGLGVDRFFFLQYGGDSFATKKPDPEGLLAIMTQARQHWRDRGVSETSLDSSGAVLVGDSAVDVMTARRAGIQSLGCGYGLDPESLRVTVPTLFCSHPAEWAEVLHLT